MYQFIDIIVFNGLEITIYKGDTAMDKIYIIGLGPGDINSLTLGAIERLNSGDLNILRTEIHPTISYLQDRDISYTSYDYVYESEENFQKVYEFIVDDLIEKVKKYHILNYFVPGNPLVAEKTVDILLSRGKNVNIDVEIIPGMSFIDPILLAVGHDPINGLKIIDGLNFKGQYVDINSGNIITQVYNDRIASSVKLALSEIYGDDYKIYVVNGVGVKDEEKIYHITIYELDRIGDINHLTSIYIPKVDKINKKIYDMNDLLDIMEQLRSADGCPWDMKQTHESIRECVIEEAYEVVDAIDRDDMDNLSEELGDILLQVIFHSQIAKDEGYFNIWDVLSGICNKLILRHPHVFKQKKVENSQEVVYNWNEIKFKGRNIDGYTDRLREIPKLPSLMRSYKVQRRAADIGFDWNSIDGALEKVIEEWNEVLEALNLFKGGDVREVEEELGDLLFAIVNVCRFLNINPEVALNKTINKFIDRFNYMELRSKELNLDLKEMTLDEMDILWDEAKLHRFNK